VEVSSTDAGERAGFDGAIAADAALVLAPER
jgi:hypothetical protein